MSLLTSRRTVASGSPLRALTPGSIRRALAPAGLLVRAGFRQQSRYRAAMLAGLATNCVFGLIRGSFLLAAEDASPDGLAGYDRAGLAAYVWYSQALLGAVTLMVVLPPVAERIRTGDIALDLLRPVPLVVNHAATALGRGLFTLLPRAVPAVAVGTLVSGFFLPLTPVPYLLGTLSVTVAIVASYLGVHCVALLGFWVVETRGIQALYGVACPFLAGLVVPLAIFPEWLRTAAAFTPFPTFLQLPVDVLSARVVGVAAVQTIGLQLFWLLVLLVVAQLLTAAGRRHLEVQGG